MFFALSGFIFFWLYAKSIESRATSAKEFFVLRFSRLYPLHFTTLLLVAIGQVLMAKIYGSSFVYGNNDPAHFISQLFFSSAVFGNSFNGPGWSVSVEILLYIAFYLVSRAKLTRWWHLAILSGVGMYWCIHHGSNLEIARGVLSFFIGGLSFRAFLGIWSRDKSGRIALALGLLAIGLWIFVPTEAQHHYCEDFLETMLAAKQSKMANFGMKVAQWGFHFSYELLLFPITIMALALWEARRGTLGRRLAVLGDISYSSYLIHFPLQMAFMLAVSAVGIPIAVFSSPLVIALFFLILLPISIVTYSYFERPAQNFLRSRLHRRALPTRSTWMDGGATASPCANPEGT